MDRVKRARRPTADVIETVLHVYGTTASGESKDETRVLAVRKFESDPAYVRVGAGVTKSTGNYESLRVDVSISIPCYPEETKAVFKELETLVSELLAESIDNYLGE